MRAIYLAPALLLAAFVVTPASAAPVAPTPSAQTFDASSPVILAQYEHRRDGRNVRRAPPRRVAPRFVPGRRYHSAPNGWHRYDRRPGDWRMRGCVLVGPIWFCP